MVKVVFPLGVFLKSILEAFVLAMAVSLDTFVASFAYGANRIRIPTCSQWVISLVCSSILAFSLLLGGVLHPYLPSWLTSFVSFALLFTLGLLKLFDSSVKACIRRHQRLSREINFSAFHLRFILRVYADPKEADKDFSRLLSPGEAASLALALSLDGLAVGFGAALSHINGVAVVLFALLANAVGVRVGGTVGDKVARKIPLDLSWVSGALLIILSLLKLR